MARFAHFLEKYRRRGGFSQAELAKRISKSPQYISALERQKGAKSPSVQALKELVNALARDKKTRVIDFRAAVDLTLSAMDLDIAFEIPINIIEELESQAEVPEESEIWILSDILAEAESKDFAKITAQNIVERRVRYTYFVPFAAEDLNWQRAIKWLLDYVDLELLKESTSIYQISNCAFTSRLRITNPRTNESSARYSLGARGKTHLRFYPAPTELVVKTVHTVMELLLRVEEQEQGQTREHEPPNDSIVGHQKLGFMRRVFPPRAGSSVDT